MSKFIYLDTKLTAPTAPFVVLTPGVAGYSDQYVAKHVPGASGSPVTSWAASGAGATLAPPSGGGTAPVTVQEEGGLRFLRTPGGAGKGRLLGPNKGTLPFTIAAVVRAPNPSTTGIFAVSGASISRNAAGNWSAVAGTTWASPSKSAGWAFVLLTIDAAKSATLRVDADETTTTVTFTPAASFSGIYFGPSTAATADILHLGYWPFALSAADRTAVHEFMRSQYPVLA